VCSTARRNCCTCHPVCSTVLYSASGWDEQSKLLQVLMTVARCKQLAAAITVLLSSPSSSSSVAHLSLTSGSRPGGACGAGAATAARMALPWGLAS
jgi:hypothetical protein